MNRQPWHFTVIRTKEWLEKFGAARRSLPLPPGIPAAAPYSGSEFDLLKGEWIRLTDPVYKKKEKTYNADTVSGKRKESAYSELREAVAALDRYTETLSGHSNHELKDLTNRIRSLIVTDRD